MNLEVLCKMSYQISIPHFYCMEYTEGNKTMKLDIDFRDTIIYLNIDLITHWKPPYDEELIQIDKKKSIINNQL